MADQVEVGPSSSTPAAKLSKLITLITPGTRTAKSIFGLGKGITDDDAQITGSRLPTRRQVLRCAKYHIGKMYSQQIKIICGTQQKLFIYKLCLSIKKQTFP